jgi:hypothetical protein
MEKNGVAPGEHYHAYKINPGPGASGTLVFQDCLTVANNYRFPLYKTASDPVFVTGDCPSAPGNSGAPLVNAQGAVTGAFQTELPFSDLQRQAWAPYLLPGEDFAPIALGTSLFCLDNEGDCPVIDGESIPRPRISDFDLPLDPAELPQEFQWKLAAQKEKTLEREETITPLCFNAPENWLGGFTTGPKYSPSYLSDGDLTLPTPTYTAKIFFNRYMQAVPRRLRTGTVQRTFHFHPSDLANWGESLVSTDNGQEEELTICPRAAD